jgi:predicted 2-oxoglutarate/Fe(II)-dependent dioxygenase YbiX
MSTIENQDSYDSVEFDVGGFHFTVLKSDIEKYPDSYLAAAVKQEWRHTDKPVHIKRDGKLFRHVYAFLVNGHLPPLLSAQNKELRAQLRIEADFYNIQELADGCDATDAVASTDTGAAVMSYNTLRTYIQRNGKRGGAIALDFPNDDEDSSALVKALKNVWAPSNCCDGVLDISEMTHDTLFGTSTVASLDLPELLAAAQASAFGKGTETLLDNKVRRSLEIPANQLDGETMTKLVAACNIQSKAQQMNGKGVELRPYKLVIYQPGGHFRKHRDAVRGEGHIGTLVVILNSPYTGGELEVTSEGHTHVFTGPFRWVAMYGDDMHKINPVTSGTRVSLIYDIYAAGSPQTTVTEQTSGQSLIASEDANSQDSAGDNDSVSSKESQPLTKHELFGGSYARRGGGLGDDVRGVTAKGRAKLHTALNDELKTYTNVIICLLHLYPACQAVPGFLKGGDAVLYDLLRDHYDVQVVYCSVYRSYSEDYGGDEEISARMFTPFGQAAEAGKSGGTIADDTLLVLRTPLRDDKMLDYTPYNDHVGNESAPEERFYVVAGLQVRRKA